MIPCENGEASKESLLILLGGILQVLKVENIELLRKLVLIDGLSQNEVADLIAGSWGAV